MRQAFGRLDGLQVAIVGEVRHSRVARSLVQALQLVSADAILVGPPTLLPPGLAPVSHDIAAIADANVIYVLRMQRERMTSSFVPSLREYTERWGITPERVRDGQRVMHPGPMNRGVEIDARAARTRRRSRPARPPLPPAGTARSSRCRTPTPSSTTPTPCAGFAPGRGPRRTSRSASSRRSRRARPARS